MVSAVGYEARLALCAGRIGVVDRSSSLGSTMNGRYIDGDFQNNSIYNYAVIN